MIEKIKNVLGDYGKVKRCYDVDTTISKAYFIEFYPLYNDMSIDYPSYWKMTIKNAIARNCDYYHHYGTNTATVWVFNDIKQDRKDKLEKIVK